MGEDKKMEIKFYAENQRRCIVCTYERNAVSEDLPENEVLLCLLGDFYLSQSTYTRIVKIEKIEAENVTTIWERTKFR